MRHPKNHLVPKAVPPACFPQALFPGEEMWRTQPAFAAKRRHTLPTPHLLGNQLPPLRPHFLASLLSRHPATLLHPHSPLQDALHAALTLIQSITAKSRLKSHRAASAANATVF